MILLSPNQQEALLLIGKYHSQGETRNMKELQEEIDVTYTTFLTLKEKLKGYGLVVERNGTKRALLPELTKKGEIVYNLLRQIVDELSL